MENMRDYIEGHNDDQAAWLGQVVIYSIPDTGVRHSLLAERLTSAGLTDYLPREPRDEDVFRRVWTNGQRRSVVHPGDTEITENYLIRPLEKKPGLIVKRIVVETVDGRGRKLDYRESVEVAFNAEHPERIRRQHMTASTDLVAMELADHLAAGYIAERGCVNGHGVRELYRKVFDATSATSLRPGGGVYFVRQAHADKVAALEDVASHIPGAWCQGVPLIDDGKQREMVKAAYEAETSGEIDHLCSEMREFLKDPEGISSERLAGYATKFKAVKAKTQEYAELLEDSMLGVESRLEIFDAVMAELVMHIKVAA